MFLSSMRLDFLSVSAHYSVNNVPDIAYEQEMDIEDSLEELDDDDDMVTLSHERSVMPVSNFSELQNAIVTAPTNGTIRTIQLTANFNVTSTINVNGGRNVVLISNNNENRTLSSSGGVTTFNISGNATLTLNEGVIISPSNAGGHSSRIVLSSGTFNMYNATVIGSNGTAFITFASPAVTISGGTFNMTDSTVIGGNAANAGSMNAPGGNGGVGVSLSASATLNMTGGSVTGGNGGNGGISF